MNDAEQHGPFCMVKAANGTSIPLFVIPFDKEGRCIAPQTMQAMKRWATSGDFTDVHVYSHGWNNVFNEAVEHYTDFFNHYFETRKTVTFPDKNYMPLLVGVIWPSTAFLAKEEETPGFAAATPHAVRVSAIDRELFAKTELSGALPDTAVPRFIELIDQDYPLTQEEALELASILLPVFEREAVDGEGILQTVTAPKLVRAWEHTADRRMPGNGGQPGVIADENEAAPTMNGARAAGLANLFNPKEILRKATVFLMKDRAGRIGAQGVGPMLQELLSKPGLRVHLAGHSFGAKVVLSALCLVDQPRKVASILLLQPAINAFCFAEHIQENGGNPGAFHAALDRTDMPVVTTYSSRDVALSSYFHLALRRDGDLGEVRPAAGPPSPYSALGGYGPGGMSPGTSKTIPMLDPPYKYNFSEPGIRLYALNGSDHAIKNHGDVRNVYTAWAMMNLVSAGELQ